MMTCARCGSLLDDSADACRACGLPVPTRVGAPALAMQATAPGPPGGGTTGLLGSLAGSPASGSPPTSNPGIWPGQLVDGKYRVERILGQGGMGAVYLAFETTVETYVVLKALLPHLVHLPGVRERMIREARALARIDHPNVVRLNAVVATGTDLVLVMEYVEGNDLSAQLERWRAEGRPTLETCLGIFGSVVDGVEAAHREGIVHRDIKPSNVLVRARDGRVKVTDFGIAKSAADDLQLTSGMIGTLYYMAPEQLRADPSLDARADIYALGILLFEMLTGVVPFQAASSYEVARQHIELPFPSLRSRAPSLALSDETIAHLDVVLARACAKHREQRYASCDELRRALAQCLAVARLPGQSPHISTPPPQSAPVVPVPPIVSLPPVTPRTEDTASPASSPAPVTPRRAGSPSPPSSSSLPFWIGGGLVVAFALGGVIWWAGADDGRPPPRPAGRATAATATTSAAPTGKAPAVVATATATATATTTAPACSKDSECRAGVPAHAVPRCVQGACSFTCVDSTVDCGSTPAACVDLTTSAHHCGTCNTECSGKKSRCQLGRCVEP